MSTLAHAIRLTTSNFTLLRIFSAQTPASKPARQPTTKNQNKKFPLVFGFLALATTTIHQHNEPNRTEHTINSTVNEYECGRKYYKILLFTHTPTQYWNLGQQPNENSSIFSFLAPETFQFVQLNWKSFQLIILIRMVQRQGEQEREREKVCWSMRSATVKSHPIKYTVRLERMVWDKITTTIMLVNIYI